MAASELAGLSARALAALIRDGKVSAAEATAAAIARAEAANPAINSVLAIEAEEATAAARAFDASGRRKAGLALAGVPLAHKDMFDRAGKIASWGAKIRADKPAERDATVIARLREAGAIGFGALNMSEFAFGITGHNYCVGHCRNPHDPAYITGGSSSGSAASVAAGIVPFALGSDTGGSIRMPASCCGIAGLRPTWGRVSRAGAMPLSASLDTIGVLARDVGDIALALAAIGAPDPRDAAMGPEPLPDCEAALAASPRGLRLGVDRSVFETVEPEISDLLVRALDVLLDAGAVEVAVKLPDLATLDVYARTLQFAEASAVHASYMRSRSAEYSDQVRTRLEDGFAVSAVAYLQAQRARPLLAAEFLAGPLSGADAMFVPVLGRGVPTIAETDVGGSASLGAMLAAMLRFTRPIGYLGVPSLALPTGKDARGIPNGFQLIGRPFAESVLLTLGAAYQKSVGVPAPALPPHL